MGAEERENHLHGAPNPGIGFVCQRDLSLELWRNEVSLGAFKCPPGGRKNPKMVSQHVLNGSGGWVLLKSDPCL